jgi:hypothetical protein
VREQNTQWGDYPFIVDDATSELFEISPPDKDPEQKPAFRVTSSTADLVKQDFELYKPSLERMVDTWREEKERFMKEQAARKKKGAGSGRSRRGK